MTKKRVLILGGATKGGIGEAISERLRWLGHETWAKGPEALDVTFDDEFEFRFNHVLNEFQPDSVVYSVGVNQLEWSHRLDRKSFERLMNVNVWGFINVLKGLQASGRAYSVLAVTSDAATRPMRTSMVYCASKAALNQVIRVASRELAASGWRINGLAPGKVEGTAMTEYVDERVLEIRNWEREHAERYERESSPIGRKLSTAEVAAAACDVLLSEALGWTGDIVTVNGGR